MHKPSQHYRNNIVGSLTFGNFMSAFVVAIGGKADMPLCSAYVRF
jgi:hypothetical protein